MSTGTTWRGITENYLARIAGAGVGRTPVSLEVAKTLISLGKSGDVYGIFLYVESIDLEAMGAEVMNYSSDNDDNVTLATRALDIMTSEVFAHMNDTDRIIDPFSYQTNY